MRARLAKTREGLTKRLDFLRAGVRVDEDLLEELEASLITADFGVETTEAILHQAQLRAGKQADALALKQALLATIRDRLRACQRASDVIPVTSSSQPYVILIVGVNGVGKTTTAGKLAARFTQSGKTVLLAAGDTFRAAAAEQLSIWGDRAGCPVVSQSQQTGSDSASVLFNAYAEARRQQREILIADTAGRLHNRVNLMEELKKIRRILNNQNPEAPHETLLVLDATTGQNAIHQTRQFQEWIGLTGLVITKLDGTAKGGVVLSVSEQFGLPVRYIGIGEDLEDLRPFDAERFADALF